MSAYQPPYTLTSSMLHRVAAISEWLGRYAARDEQAVTPLLRRGNRIRTIQASLAIENNTLSLEQVTAVIEGKRVLGHPREIQEVRNAFAAYEHLRDWQPDAKADLLAAHGLLMAGLVDLPGQFRRGGVGVFRGTEVVHMAPPAERVPWQIEDLLNWLRTTDEHPLIASCVFHYEFEFIHPFEDGNGRLGRLWQTLILSRWKSPLAFLPVETVIRERQEAYYAVLSSADSQGEATPFVEFMLEALETALREATDQVSVQVTDQVSEQVCRLLAALENGPRSVTEIMAALRLAHRPSFSKSSLNPALNAGLVERTEPDAPRSPTQRYRLTEHGRRVVAALKQGSLQK